MNPTETPVPNVATGQPNPFSYSIDVVAAVALILALIIGVVFLILLAKNGWKFKDIFRVSVGGVEVERKIGEKKEGNSNQPGINVTVKDSSFADKVGDIGGVIIKGDENEIAMNKSPKNKN